MILQASGLTLPGRLLETSITVEAGQLVCLVGPNGSGKTSLLHAIAGIGPKTGIVAIDGQDPRFLPPAVRAAYLTYLPATRDVAWPLSAGDLIALGGEPRDLPELDLDRLMDRRVNSLSTGERSRVLIARALLPSPRLLLLDEPTANLDPLWQIRMMEVIRSETRTGSGSSALMAIHDLELAARYADRIIVMNGGRIVGEGLSKAHLAQVFGIRKVDGKWQPVTSTE